MDSQSIKQRIEKACQPSGSGCWIWGLSRDKHGYGRIMVGRRARLAHRVAYEAWEGAIPSGMVLDHTCRVRCCVNPAHLRVVTPVENVLAGTSFSALNARKTSCPKGHEYSGVNSQGRRVCGRCQVINTMRYRAKSREQKDAA